MKIKAPFRVKEVYFPKTGKVTWQLMIYKGISTMWFIDIPIRLTWAYFQCGVIGRFYPRTTLVPIECKKYTNKV